MDDAINFFNSGRYFEAHEAWEDMWREESGPLRSFYQGLVHAAVGLLHRERGNSIGMASQLKKCLARLQAYPSSVDGIDVDRLRAEIRQVLEGRGVEGALAVRIVRLKKNPVVVESDGTADC